MPSPSPALAATVLCLTLWLGPAAAATGGEPASLEPLTAELRDDLGKLLEAVSRGDEQAKARLAERIHDGLDTLERGLADRPATTVGDHRPPWRLTALAPDLEGVAARTLARQRGLSDQLEALRRNWVGRLGFATADEGQLFVGYHAPSGLFVATERHLYGSWSDTLLGVDGRERARILRLRGEQIEAAREAAAPLVVDVDPAIARRMGRDEVKIRFGYLVTGRVRPPAGKTGQDLLEEVRRQLAYIVNAKSEGPPLLRALRAGLFFDEELGFMAWGGRWPAFDGELFVLRYDPDSDSYLVRLEPVP